MAVKACAVATLAALALPAHAQIETQSKGTAIADGSNGKDKPAEYTELAEEDCWSAFDWCAMPYLNHAVVLFGDGHATKPTYATSSHTLGNSGSTYLRGIAVNGDARFLGASQTIEGTFHGNASIITGAIRGDAGLLNFHDGLEREQNDFTDLYNVEAWRQFANDLWQAKQQGDKKVKPRVRFYFPEEKYSPDTPVKDRVVVLKRDSPDYVSPGQQVLHVVIGTGRVKADNDQNNKIDGAIIAPDADVLIHRKWQHAHGFIVARTLREWWTPGMPSDTGLQIHGQIPTNLYCESARPDKDCEENAPCREEGVDQHYCQMPNLEHALVAFGDPELPNNRAIDTDAHTFGNAGDEYRQGVAGGSDYKLGDAHHAAVDGPSIFGGFAYMFNPNFNAGVKEGVEGANAFAAAYKVDAWTKWVDDLFNSHLRGDSTLDAETKGGQVRFYEVEEGEQVFLDIDKQNLDAATTTEVHVVRGAGKVVVPCKDSNGQDAKVWGSIIAPEATVKVQDGPGLNCGGSFIDGVIVSKYFREGWHRQNTGFQIHGRLPSVTCECLPSQKPGCGDELDPCLQDAMADIEDGEN